MRTEVHLETLKGQFDLSLPRTTVQSMMIWVYSSGLVTIECSAK
jgi:hypothetical protein